jgi:hypothetical protein
VESDTQAPERGALPQLQPLDASGTATLYLNRAWRFGGEIWLLTQAGKPVGMVERTASRIALRTVSGHWRGGVRRRARRLGWHLEFTPADADGPTLKYHPRTLRPGGDFVLPDGPRYTLRCPLLRSYWRLVAVPGGELGRIAFRPYRDSEMKITLGGKRTDEPLLPLLILAASAAILVHWENQGAGAGGG